MGGGLLNLRMHLTDRRGPLATRLTAQLEQWNATLPTEYDKTDDKQN